MDPDSDSRNVIAGNDGSGIMIVNDSDFNEIRANYIGVDATGGTRLANAGDGITISNSSDHNVIGTNDDGADDETEGKRDHWKLVPRR